MDFHCLIKSAAGAVLYLSARHTSWVHNQPVLRPFGQGRAQTLAKSLPCSGSLCACLLKAPGLIFRTSILQALNAAFWGISESEFKNWQRLPEDLRDRTFQAANLFFSKHVLCSQPTPITSCIMQGGYRKSIPQHLIHESLLFCYNYYRKFQLYPKAERLVLHSSLYPPSLYNEQIVATLVHLHLSLNTAIFEASPRHFVTPSIHTAVRMSER